MLTTWHPLPAKVGRNFADKQQSFSQCSSFADSGHGVFCGRQWETLSKKYVMNSSWAKEYGQDVLEAVSETKLCRKCVVACGTCIEER
jgi:hypothetical protein